LIALHKNLVSVLDTKVIIRKGEKEVDVSKNCGDFKTKEKESKLLVSESFSLIFAMPNTCMI
jgi:hypothetical protein